MTPWRLRSRFTGSADPHARRLRVREPARSLRAACERRDAAQVAAVLTRDAHLLIDSDGAFPVALSDVRGPVPIAAALLGTLSRFPDAVFTDAEANGMPAFTLAVDGRTVAVIVTSVRRRRIGSIWVVTAPDKLVSWDR